ncbi:MAG TPA: cytochrome c [Rhizomicrobium sp.]|jgi:mono/diheme cytochrome c family protein|nr:cytochrome c [Rhizomicrobium sp.]
MRSRLIAAALVIVAATGEATPALSQSSSVWDGAYTAAQADRGAIKYRQECVMCHGPVLEGNGEAPPLTGRFIPDWAGTRLSDLFEKIQTTMPLFAPGTLSPADTADLLAFILQANSFPAGPKELQAGDALKLVSFDVSKPAVKETKPPKRH